MRTQTEILQEMLAAVPSDIDRREGSLIYTALAPVAAMCAEQQFIAQDAIDSTMADTATGVLQRELYKEYGVHIREATASTRKGVFIPDTVAVGSRFGADGLAYKVVAPLEDDGWQLQCETAGEVGNRYSGAILPLDNNNPDLDSAIITDVLVYGQDTEDSEAFRNRFYMLTRYPDYGWNKNGYRTEVLKIPGVGEVEPFPTPQGLGGKVHVVIAAPDNTPASELLVATVQQHLDPAPQGEGNGAVPIGHTASVSTVAALPINVAATIAVKSGYTIASLLPLVTTAIDTYLHKLDFRDTTVRVSQIETTISLIDGVVDYGAVTINGTASNVRLQKTWDCYQVAVMGTVTLEEMPNV